MFRCWTRFDLKPRFTGSAGTAGSRPQLTLPYLRAMAVSVTNSLHAVWGSYLYLLDPPANSWVTRIASTFWLLAAMIFVPMAFITSLVRVCVLLHRVLSDPRAQDIASWLIMRTMGTISEDLPPSVIVRNVGSAPDESSAETSPTEPTHKGDPLRPRAKRTASKSSLNLNLAITPAQGGSGSSLSTGSSNSGFYGSGGLNGQSVHSGLAGEGIVSPIVSRAASPELSRRRSRAPSSATTPNASSFIFVIR